jgi:hypothetical protein
MLTPSRPHLWFRTGAAALFLLALAVPARAAELDPLLPDDTEFYLSVNVRQILDSEIVKKFGLDAAKDALKNIDEVNDVLKDLGFDPFKDLDQIIVSAPGGKETDRGLVVFRGRFDVAKFKAKADEVAKDQSDLLKVHKVADGAATHLLYEVSPPGADQALFVAVADKTTILASAGKDYVVDALKKGKAKAKVTLKSKAMQALLEKMDGKQSIALATLSSALAKGDWLDEAPKQVKDVLDKLDAIGAGVTVTGDVKLQVAGAAKTDRGAKELKSAADTGVKAGLVGLALLAGERKELAAALEVLKTVKVSSKGKVVTITAKVTAEVIADALKKSDD